MAFQPTVPDSVNAANSSTSPLETLAITGASLTGSPPTNLVLTGTWSSVPGRVGQYYYVSGFTGAATGNNSTIAGFVCTAQGVNTITLTDAGGYNGFTGAPTAAQMFIGTAVDCTAQPICSVTTFAFSDQASTTNGLQLQWSQDNTNWDHIQRETNTAGASSIVSDKVRARYFRVVYINGAVSQTYLRLQTLLSTTNTSGTIRDLDTLVNSDDEAMICRSILTGRASPSSGYTYTDVITDVYGSLQVVVGGAAADAFGRLRIAEPTTLFDAQFQYDTQPLLFQTSLVGSGTVAKTTNESSLTLSTGGTTSTWGAINQTKQYFRYEPGKSQQIVMTGLLGVKTANVRSRMGYFDANDGVYFEMDGTDGMSINVRTSTSGSPVNSAHILQANWNFDKMDGTGPSGATLDWSKTQIFTVDFQWLGVGRVRWGFFVNGVLVICHQIYNSNVITSPYMNTANLPCRAEIFNTGAAAGTTTMKQVCMTVVSEGGAEYPQAYQFSVSNGSTPITAASGTRTPLLSIRPKTTFNSITNRAKIIVTSVELQDLATTNAIFWELVYNGTLSGGVPTWTDVNTSYSGVQWNVDSTTCANGIVVASGYAIAQGKGGGPTTSVSEMRYPFTLDIAGTVADTFTLCATGLSGNASSSASISWSEIR